MLLGFLCPQTVPPSVWISQLSLGKGWVLKIPIPPSFRKMATWLSVISKPVLNGRQSELGKCWYVTFGMAQKSWAPDGRKWVVRNHTDRSCSLDLLASCLEGYCCHTESNPGISLKTALRGRTHKGRLLTSTRVKLGCHYCWRITNTCSLSWP